MMRIALAQINPTVGDVVSNARLIAGRIDAARREGADLVILPELAVIGYPPKDLLLKEAVVGQCAEAVERLAGLCVGIGAIIGYPCPSDNGRCGRSLFNAAAFCIDGRIVHRYVKSLLPTYDVFDETRYFEPAPLPGDPALAQDPHTLTPADVTDLARFRGVKVGVSICEDLWNDRDIFAKRLYHDDPISRLASLGAQLFVNCSASPFSHGKHDFRLKLFASAARRYGLPLAYCNQVGGNDELVFDGCSCVMDAQGRLVAQARAFAEDLLVVDLPLEPQWGGNAPAAAAAGHGGGTVAAPAAPVGRIERVPQGLAAVYEALVLGLGDYCVKCGFNAAVVGLSGGIDSALAAALCVAALGNDNVQGVTMPSRYSSPGSVEDARALARNLGIRFDEVPIEPAHAALEKMLQPLFAGREADVTEENLQARIRGTILMAISNKDGSLLVTTGNKSELAVGYCTLYGDMAGGLALLSDVPKTMVWRLARWINEDPDSPLRQTYGGPVIPQHSIDKPPSAELRPDQTDQDSLPPYDLLDQIIERYVEQEQSAATIIEQTGIEAAVVRRVLRLIDVSEYKRKQAPPGIRISGRAFGFGRRMPIAQRHDPAGGPLPRLATAPAPALDPDTDPARTSPAKPDS